MEEKTYINYDIARLDGKDCFVTLNDGFYQESGKLMLNFCKYNPNNGNKMDFSIQIFLSKEDFLGLYNRLNSSRMEEYARTLANTEGKGNTTLYSSYTGYGKAKAWAMKSKLPFEIESGEAVSKVFTVTPYAKGTYALRAGIGKGKESKLGAVMPDGPYIRYMFVAGTFEQILGFLHAGVLRLQSWDTKMLLDRFTENRG